jgi:hypothetical protein
MDVVPFITAAKTFEFHNYRVVLKLHTKNNRTELGRAHGALFSALLLGSARLVTSIVEAFNKDPNLLLVGPNDLYRSAHYMMYNNRAVLGELCELVGLSTDPVNWGFFAGTMFWIRGSRLAPLIEHHDGIESLASKYGPSKDRTGRDGSVAHAMERIWGALAAPETRRVGLTYLCDAEYSRFTLRVDHDSVILSEQIRRLGASDVLLRWQKAGETVKALEKSKCFESDYYKTFAPECDTLNIDPCLHYVLYGELFNLDPCRSFSTTYYKLRRRDVVRNGINVFQHYLSHGRREGIAGTPAAEDWLQLADLLKLFDSDWYRNEHGAVGLSGLSSHEHFRIVGAPLKLATSPNFDPKVVPVLSGYLEGDPLIIFMREHYLDEAWMYDELTRILQNNDLILIPQIVSAIFDCYGETAAPACALALYHVRMGEWERAGSILDRYWKASLAGELCVRHRRSILPASLPGNEIFRDVATNKGNNNYPRVCIYTALFGDIDVLPPILTTTKNCTFICFTDTPGDVEGWEYRALSPQLGHPNLDAKLFKVLPDEFLSEFEYTMFIDANTLILGRIDEFISKYLLSRPFVMFRHPERSDVFTEGLAIIESERHSPPRILAQIAAYRAEGLPHESGLVEASFIWRRTGDFVLEELMEAWWQHILNYSRRDQLSLGFLMWKHDVRPEALPPDLGNSRENRYFVKLPHTKLPHDVSTGSVQPTRQRQWTREADIWVLYGTRYAEAGSTILRGLQLHEIIQAALPAERGVFYSSFDQLSDKIVYLTKGYLIQHGAEGVESLKKRGNVILADFVDARPDASIIPFIDVLIASSLRAFITYRIRHPEIRVHHITHHVDLRITPGSPRDQFTAGYFGEIVNTLTGNGIGEWVEFIHVDTSRANHSWLERLQDFSFHYAVRRSRDIDDQKPFLKGFTAAHCGANILIQANAGDASYYLGEDYPYLMPENASVDDIIEYLRRAKEGYGGPEWRDGLTVMEEVRERSSLMRVAAEVRNLLQTL